MWKHTHKLEARYFPFLISGYVVSKRPADLIHYQQQSNYPGIHLEIQKSKPKSANPIQIYKCRSENQKSNWKFRNLVQSFDTQL